MLWVLGYFAIAVFVAIGTAYWLFVHSNYVYETDDWDDMAMLAGRSILFGIWWPLSLTSLVVVRAFKAFASWIEAHRV